MVLTGFGNREKVWNLNWALQGLEKCLNSILGLKKNEKVLKSVYDTCEPKGVEWVIGVNTWGVEGPRGVKHTALYEQLKLMPAYL